MEDRFTRGFYAGVIAALLTNVASFLEGALQLTTVRTADLIGIIIYAHEPPFSLGEIAFAIFGHVFLCGVIGVAFAYLVPGLTSRFLWIKGWLFSEAVWFTIYTITTLYQVPGTAPTPFKTVVADIINATIYGNALAYILQVFSRTSESISLVKASMPPSMKPFDSEDDEGKN